MSISNNDREFECTMKSCGVADPTSELLGSISINAKFLDIDNLRDELYEILKTVNDSIDKLKSWLKDKEQKFEMQYTVREVNANITLFNKLSDATGKLRQYQLNIDKWYSNFQDLISLCMDYMGKYAESMATIKSFDTKTVITGGLTESLITLAKENIKKSKTIQKQISSAILSEAKIKTMLSTIQRQVDSFSRGYIIVDDESFNLKYLGTIIDNLTDSESPLYRVQENLAQLINSSKIQFKLESVDPNEHDTPATTFISEITNNKPITEKDILNYLEKISTSVLYTNNTKSDIEKFIDIVYKYIPLDNENRPAVDASIEQIRSNVPDKLVEQYQESIRTKENIYLRLSELNSFIHNIVEGDKIYIPIFQKMYNEILKESLKLLEETPVDMDTLTTSPNRDPSLFTRNSTYKNQASSMREQNRKKKRR